jgi:hypothetical protein
VAGIITGAVATAVYTAGKGWTTVIPANAWVGGLAAAILIGGPSPGCCPLFGLPLVAHAGPPEPVTQAGRDTLPVQAAVSRS